MDIEILVTLLRALLGSIALLHMVESATGWPWIHRMNDGRDRYSLIRSLHRGWKAARARGISDAIVPKARRGEPIFIWREPFRYHAWESIPKISAFSLGMLVFIWLEDLTPMDPISLAGDLLLMAILISSLLIPPRSCIGEIGISRGGSLIRWQRYLSHSATRLNRDHYVIRIRYMIWKYSGSMRILAPRRAVIELERIVRKRP